MSKPPAIFFRAQIFDRAELVVGLPEVPNPAEAPQIVWNVVSDFAESNEPLGLDVDVEGSFDFAYSLALVTWSQAKEFRRARFAWQIVNEARVTIFDINSGDSGVLGLYQQPEQFVPEEQRPRQLAIDI